MYRQMSFRRWTGRTGRAIRGNLPAQVILDYLITCQHSSMIGIYYLPLTYIENDTGIPLEGASKGVSDLESIGFCYFDHESEWIWVKRMLAEQTGVLLKPKDNRISSINKAYQELPNIPFLGPFFDMYAESHKLEMRRDYEERDGRGFEGASKGLCRTVQNSTESIETGINESTSVIPREHTFALRALTDSTKADAVIFEIPLAANQFHEITAGQIRKWQAVYPHIDVAHSIDKFTGKQKGMQASNPSALIHAIRIHGTINSWLSKEFTETSNGNHQRHQENDNDAWEREKLAELDRALGQRRSAEGSDSSGD